MAVIHKNGSATLTECAVNLAGNGWSSSWSEVTCSGCLDHAPAEVRAARASFDEPNSWSARRRGTRRDDGREERSFPHTYGVEGGGNFVD